jgi:hypothetical protein
MNEKNKVIRLARNNFKMRFFLLKKLPLAFIAGLRITEISGAKASVSLPYNQLNKNPFQSIYFAALSMAAELSTGILAMAAISEKPVPVSMLVFDMSAKFVKKARTKITFTCLQGNEIFETVNKCINSGEGQTIHVISKGIDNEGIEVAEFNFTWTFKVK